MATLKIYNGSTWDTAVGKVWDGSAWVEKMKFYDGTQWVDLFASGPSVVVAPSKSIIKLSTSPSDAYAYVEVNSSGSLLSYKGTSAPGTYNVYETWLDSGLNSEVWVERVINSGSLFADAGSGRLACTTSRAFGVRELGIGSSACNLTLNFYDAASGGSLLDSQVVTLNAQVDF